MKTKKMSFKLLLNSIAFLFAVVLLVAALPEKAQAANGPTYSGIKIKDITGTRVMPGTSHSILGTVTSGTTYNLQYVEAYVYDRIAGKRVTPKAGVNGIGKRTYSLRGSQVDYGVPFASLAPGDYDLVISAGDTKGNTSTYRLYFYVASDLVNSYVNVSTKNMKKGYGYNITGRISSNFKITRVRAVIQHYNGSKWVDTNQKYDYKPNVKSIDVVSSPINMKLKFGSLPASSNPYRVKVEEWDSSNTKWTSWVEGIYIR